VESLENDRGGGRYDGGQYYPAFPDGYAGAEVDIFSKFPRVWFIRGWDYDWIYRDGDNGESSAESR
jgi:hypothetical protein